MEGISSCWIMWNCMYLWFVQYWYRYVKKSLRFIISYHFYLLLQISHASTWMISYQCVSYDQGPFLIVITTSNMVCSKHARKSYIFVHFNYLPMSLIIRRVSIFILLFVYRAYLMFTRNPLSFLSNIHLYLWLQPGSRLSNLAMDDTVSTFDFTFWYNY